mgnify:CR=1 FL=1
MLIITFFLLMLSCFEPATTNNASTPMPETSIQLLEHEFLETNSPSPKLRSYWVSTPDILICDNVVPTRKVKAAAEFWSQLGYSFGEINDEPSQYECMQRKTNQIVFQLPTQGIAFENNLALTKTYIEKSQSINLRAEIYILPKSHEKILVVEHELGHALGWGHTGGSYHLMNPRWERIGHHTRGLNKKEHDRQVALIRRH